MSFAARTQEILTLARSHKVPDRERLLLAIVDLCTAAAGSQAELDQAPVQSLLSSIFMGLVVEAERDIRIRLADKLAHADWAPAALINVLALDDIEIARPIIAASPVLRDHDLIRLLVESTLEHQIEVARRPYLGPPVIAAVLQQAEPALLTALAGNHTALVSDHDLHFLVGSARRIAALRSPLARHPLLNEAMAKSLYSWVGQGLRRTLASRFRLDTKALDNSLAQAVTEAHSGAVNLAEEVRKGEPDPSQDQMEQRLVTKLHLAGQLQPGYLLRVLREGRLSLFVHGLTTLGRFEAGQVRTAIDGDQPELLALACGAVQIDRSVFPAILTLVRNLNGGKPGGGQEGARRAIGAFGPFQPETAGSAFRQALAQS